MGNVLIALDQGNSKIELVIASTMGHILARERLTYPQIRNIEEFEKVRWRYIRDVFCKAMLSLNKSNADIVCLLAAVCGADCSEDCKEMQQTLSETLCIKKEIITVINDSVAALHSVISLDHVSTNLSVIYAGSMFNCSLLSHKGAMFTYGKSINIYDNGAYAIGQQVWSAVMDAYNGFSEPTILTSLFLQYHKSESLKDLISYFTTNRYIFTPSNYATILFDAVRLKDKIAIEIMAYFAHRWSMYVSNGWSKIGVSKNEPKSIILAGGVFKNCGNLWVQMISENISRNDKNAKVLLANTDPIAGALYLALEQFNARPMPIEIIQNIYSSPLYSLLQVDYKK